MRTIRAVAAMFTVALVGAFLHSAPASGAVPDAAVHVDSQAYEGQFNTLYVGVRGMCAPGFTFKELGVVFTQGDLTAPASFGRSFVCDNKWHRQTISSPEGFEPGPARAVARLKVTKTSTGAAGTDAVHNTKIYVRPGAETLIPATATLQSDKSVKITLRARCDKPWVLAEFDVNLNQGEFPDQASAGFTSDSYPPTCDGTYYTKTFVLKGSPADFHKGALRVDTTIHTLDPVQFDPGPSDTSTRVVTVQ
jgi:hypothetical protein